MRRERAKLAKAELVQKKKEESAEKSADRIAEELLLVYNTYYDLSFYKYYSLML